MAKYTENEAKVIKRAKNIIFRNLKTLKKLTSSAETKDYLKLHFTGLEHEVFSVLYLDNQHGVIVIEDLFHGTIDGAAVYPREVVKRALFHNAAAVMLAHNHPSNSSEPSQADIRITNKIRAALGTVDIRLLDHFVVTDITVVSFAERGLI